VSEDADFLATWGELPRAERARIRRQVRLGRPFDYSGEARLGVEYANFQRSRVWVRMFWIWFLPGLLLSLGIAAQIHPIVIGIVIALAAQAVFARRNLARVELINSDLLKG
jgi:hypothetical protein